MHRIVFIRPNHRRTFPYGKGAWRKHKLGNRYIRSPRVLWNYRRGRSNCWRLLCGSGAYLCGGGRGGHNFPTSIRSLENRRERNLIARRIRCSIGRPNLHRHVPKPDAKSGMRMTTMIAIMMTSIFFIETPIEHYSVTTTVPPIVALRWS